MAQVHVVSVIVMAEQHPVQIDDAYGRALSEANVQCRERWQGATDLIDGYAGRPRPPTLPVGGLPITLPVGGRVAALAHPEQLQLLEPRAQQGGQFEVAEA